jgi:hypothetical protein
VVESIRRIRRPNNDSEGTMKLPSLLALILLFVLVPVVTATMPAVYRGEVSCWSAAKLLPAAGTGFSEGGAPRSPDGEPRVPTAWTFAPNAALHPETSGQHLWPEIAVSADGKVGAAWMDDHAAGGYHIFYVASNDGGATWSLPERVDTRTTGAYSKFVSLGFTPSGDPVAVWEDDRTGAINVYFSRRDPISGWGTNVRVNTAGSPPDGSYFMDPSIAVLDDLRYFVAWTDWREGIYNQVYMRGTRDGGVTWTPETRISDELGYQPLAGDPCLIVNPDSGPAGAEVLYCVMNDWRGNVPGGRFPDVYFSRSSDGGASWSNGLAVNDITEYFQQVSSHALVRLPDGTLSSGWLSGDFSSSTFRSCVSTDQGRTWSASARIDDPALGGTGTWSSIAGAGGFLFAAFDCYQGSWNSYFRASADGGRTWTEPVVRMDDDVTGAATGNSVLAAISSNRVVGAWQDTRPGTGAWKIYASAGIGDPASVDGSSHDGSSHDGSSRDAGAVVCFPNPSKPGDRVEIRLDPRAGSSPVDAGSPGSAPRILRLIDTAGRCLWSAEAQGTSGPLGWDGRDQTGRMVPSGAYWISAGDRGGVRLVRVR